MELKIVGRVIDFGCVIYKPKAEFLETLTGKKSHESNNAQSGELAFDTAAFVVPILSEKDLLSGYLFLSGKKILHTLLMPWKNNPTKITELQERPTEALNKLFEKTFCPVVVDALNVQGDATKKVDCHLLVLRPKTIFVNWIKDLVGRNILPSEYGAFKTELIPSHFANGILINATKSDDERAGIVKDNCITIFELILSLYCIDATAWPSQRNYDTFREWVDWAYLPLYEIGDARVKVARQTGIQGKTGT